MYGLSAALASRRLRELCDRYERERLEREVQARAAERVADGIDASSVTRSHSRARSFCADARGQP